MSIFIATAIIGSTLIVDGNTVFASKKKHNDSEQGIGQDTESFQSSRCSSNNGSEVASCNNLDASLNFNFGNNALGQQ